MPYWLHLKDTDPEMTGTPFDSMVDARKDIDPKTQTVTFVASFDERESWQNREITRFDSGDYLPTPWAQDINRAYGAPYSWPVAVKFHYAHRSIQDPGMIAYTKNDEHGINDRQTRVAPGRYLTEYFKDFFTPEQIAELSNRCKAETLDLQIARSEADIVAIYSRKDCGFSSCMQLKRSPEYDFQHAVERGDRKHPAAVYGDSDLGVAYLGDIATKITARAVVWPDKKRYTRVYGDATLTNILRANGYTQGALLGARVHYIESGEGVIMPYIDGVSNASQDDSDGSGQWVVLDDNGDLECQNTTGYGDGSEDPSARDEDNEDDDDRYTCERCSDRFEYRRGRSTEYCPDCFDSRELCSVCDEWSWQDHTALNGGGQICETCLDRQTVTCAGMVTVERSQADNTGAGAVVQCDETWHEQIEFTPDEQAVRDTNGVSTLCRSCAEHKQLCKHCAQTFDVEHMACDHCGLSVRCTAGTLYLYTYGRLQSGHMAELSNESPF